MADPRLFSGLLVVSTGAKVWPIAPRFEPIGLFTRDEQDGGVYQITGTVDELGQVGQYRVRLFDRVSGRSIRSVVSGSNGTFTFDYLKYRSQEYFLVAFDRGGSPVNAAIADLVTPEAMP